MGNATSRDRLMKLLEPVVGAEGLDLEDVTVTPAGKRRLLRVVVDRDGGVSLDDVAQVSHAVSARLDADDAMGNAPYVLEVSSPGVDRPLTEPRHWRRAVRRLVKADLRDGTTVEGRIAATDDAGVELDVDGTRRRIEYQDLTRGRVQVEFRRFDDAEDDGEDGDEG
ncbi:ribosome maturation factor RimP [Streptosporangium becharense]|uniref:Ribosome maturation factor RimP n=1 Tax=Streptosporangium becharense TaxID=1816182 RepID=A0A7W9MFI3_9ACTN|nr:ribosome maturation factor RimP [Streptosporangium becharense]MBB2912283.1 ribosome maturation factor RimP [Streptosporangium becharense]MBB5818830.1 ribosome maturation factor RimP [Streptosporangium becharense]